MRINRRGRRTVLATGVAATLALTTAGCLGESGSGSDSEGDCDCTE